MKTSHTIFLCAFIISLSMVLISILTNAPALCLFGIILSEIMLFLNTFLGIKDLLIILTS